MLRAGFALALILALAAFWVDRHVTVDAIRATQDDILATQADVLANQKAGCRRGNLVRMNQRIILDVLRTTAQRFAVEDPDPAVRIYLRTQLPILQAARDRIVIVDCGHLPAGG